MGLNLKIARSKKGIKQEDLSRIVGISQNTLCGIERGKVDPRRSIMINLSKALDVPVQELFFSENEK